MARAAGAVLLVLGAALASLPAFTWYSAPPAADPTHASGFAVAGELWTLPALALLVILAGAALVSSRAGLGRAVSRWAGPLTLGAGLLAVGFALWARLDRDAVLTVSLSGGDETIAVPVSLALAATITPVVAGAIAVVGAAATWIGWRP